jgi:hypothetical protein
VNPVPDPQLFISVSAVNRTRAGILYRYVRGFTFLITFRTLTLHTVMLQFISVLCLVMFLALRKIPKSKNDTSVTARMGQTVITGLCRNATMDACWSSSSLETFLFRLN